MTRPASTILAAGIHKPLPERVASPDVGASMARAHGFWVPEILRLPPPAPVPDLARETAHAQRVAGTLPTARARGGASC